jgi:bla regulator protein blaR1
MLLAWLASSPFPNPLEFQIMNIRIVTQRLDKISFGRKLLLPAMCIPVVAGPVVSGLMNTPQGFAQSPQATDTPLPSFEVASVKQHRSGDNNVHCVFDPGRFTATNVTTKFLIQFAYNIKNYQASGGPSWINSERYDIDAKVEDASAVDAKKLTFQQQEDCIRLMVQSLLSDRFKLTLGHETKELPVYVLLVAKNGPKLEESKPGDTYPNGIKGPDGEGGAGTLWMGEGKLAGQGVRIAQPAHLLSEQLDRTVLDRTGLTGTYDFKLQWTPDESQPFRGIDGNPVLVPQDVHPPDSSGPSIFTAIQEQLGLKLESQKGPAKILVVDHVEKPSEN